MSGEETLPDRVRRGRTTRYRFVQTPQWALLMTRLSDAGYRVYSLLLAHVNTADDDAEVWPQQQTLAEMLGRHRNSVSRVITRELVPLGLADVEVERYGTNNTRRRNVYTVHEVPPEGHEGWASLTEWYAAHPRPEPAPTNRRDRKTAGQPGRTKNGASGDTTDGASGRTKNSAVTRRRKNDGEEEDARARVDGDPEPSPPAPGGPGADAPDPDGATPDACRLVEDMVTAAYGTEPNRPQPSDAEMREYAGWVDQARAYVDEHPVLTWETYRAYLLQGWRNKKGEPSFRTLRGVLQHRLSANGVAGDAYQWAWASGALSDDSQPNSGGEDFAGVQLCPVHRAAMSVDAAGGVRCGDCETDVDPVRRHRRDHGSDQADDGGQETAPPAPAPVAEVSLEEVRRGVDHDQDGGIGEHRQEETGDDVLDVDGGEQRQEDDVDDGQAGTDPDRGDDVQEADVEQVLGSILGTDPDSSDGGGEEAHLPAAEASVPELRRRIAAGGDAGEAAGREMSRRLLAAG